MDAHPLFFAAVVYLQKQIYNHNLVFLQSVMSNMAEGISNITIDMSESSSGVSEVAENIGSLASAISDICYFHF